MDNALLPTETSGTTKSLRKLAYALLFLLTLTVCAIGFVKGLSPGRHGLIFVSLVLLPFLATAWLLLKWTDGDSIDERLTRMASINATMLVVMDIALMVVMLEKPGSDRWHTERRSRLALAGAGGEGAADAAQEEGLGGAAPLEFGRMAARGARSCRSPHPDYDRHCSLCEVQSANGDVAGPRDRRSSGREGDEWRSSSGAAAARQ